MSALSYASPQTVPQVGRGSAASTDVTRSSLRLNCSPKQKLGGATPCLRLNLNTFTSKGSPVLQKLGTRGLNKNRALASSKGPLQVHAAQDAAELPEALKKIVGMFQMVPDPLARYKQLLFYASKLQPLDAESQTDENKVEGCVSQVWVVARLEEGKVYFQADSDSQLTKGLAALLVEGLSGATPQEVVKVDPSFIEMLGLKQSLTPSRNNGFLNMLRLMQKKTVALFMEQEKESEAASTSAAEPESEGEPELPDGEGGVAARMERKLTEALGPVRLVVEDESGQHAGHGGSKGLRSGETHFRVDVVSEAFEGLSLVKRHRRIYELLDDEIKGGVHALSLNTKTPTEVQN